MASEPQEQDVVYVPLAGTRSQSIQRLQIGLAGLGAMVLLVGLANIIMDRAQQTEAAAVPEAAATVAASPTPAANDPLADAGVAPEIAVVPKPSASRPVVIDPDRIPSPPKH
jgi:hypothetical protein